MPILKAPTWDRPEGGEGNPGRGFGGFLCRMGIHRYRTIKWYGANRYVRCDRCGRRDIDAAYSGHSPVRKEWITKGDLRPVDWFKVTRPGSGSAMWSPRPTPPPPPPTPTTGGLSARPEIAAKPYPPPPMPSPPSTMRIVHHRAADGMARTFVFDPTEPDSVNGFVEGIRAFERNAPGHTGVDRIANLDYTKNLDILQAEVRLWTRKAFPDSTQVSRARHLLREAAELYAAVRLPEIVDFNDDSEVLWGKLTQEVNKETNATLSRIVYGDSPYKRGKVGEELADCLLLLCDMAAAFTDMPGMVPWSLIAEARGKFNEAKARRYSEPDSSGVSEHVRPGSE